MIYRLRNLIISLLLLIVLGSVFKHFPYGAGRGSAEITSESYEIEDFGILYTVSCVHDGDTISVLMDGEEVKVRFIGVDTPESVHIEETLNTPEGVIASSFTKELLDGEKVYLVYDMDKEDDYGRKLAYVYMENKEMVNALLLEKGYARCMSIEPNTQFEKEFSNIENSAKKNKAGFWATGFFE